ncbi:hypothetical protein GF337_12835 [candidate division KSB1 bacterium]|nr:hypothetical protein [candidate division KSB1 bacterium]
MKNSLKAVVIFVAFLTFALSMILVSGDEKQMPFGGEKDVQFAEAAWQAMEGYENWPMKSGFLEGSSPHGKVVRLYYNMISVDGKPYHVVIKDNFGGEGITIEKAAESPDDYFGAATVMIQREEGYDPDNQNWFWAKYMADGSLDENARGMKMAGKVAKGMNVGCIACHADAKDNDFLFTND